MHRWKFFKSGSSYQAAINTAADIENIGELDKKLWTALACPTSGLVFDEKLLKEMDPDNDGRIRYGDIVAATRWICANLKDASSILEQSDALKLSNINDATEEGKTLLTSAKAILKNLGKADSDEISVSDFADMSKIFANSAFNADGIITELSVGGNDALKNLFNDILSVSEPKKDRSGLDGIDADDINKFFAQTKAYLSWLDAGKSDKSLSPFGDSTPDACKTYLSVKDKIDDYFTRAEILRFAPNAQSAVNGDSDKLAKILSAEVNSGNSELKDLPAEFVGQDGILDLLGAVNPAWKGLFAAAANQFAIPVCGTAKISREDWEKIGDTFKPFIKWQSENPNSNVSQIPESRLREIVNDGNDAGLLKAIEADNAVSKEVQNIENVEKLARLNKSLCTLLRNFISFQEFYKDKTEAIFQCGQLYIDGRMCSLCIKVGDVAKHSTMAALSYGYLLYCVCKRKGEADMNIVAMVTSGDSDNLIVGKNGIFYDRNGRDWDASVVKIIDNPIGITQAFFSPYKRFVKWISEQIAKRALAADQNVVSSIEKGKLVDDKSKKIDIGTVAALGVAVGGITTAIGLVLNAFVKLGPWMPLGIIGVLLAISLPSMIIAAMKIRLRNLAPLLDANGWAINNKANINIFFGSHLTQMPKR